MIHRNIFNKKYLKDLEFFFFFFFFLRHQSAWNMMRINIRLILRILETSFFIVFLIWLVIEKFNFQKGFFDIISYILFYFLQYLCLKLIILIDLIIFLFLEDNVMLKLFKKEFKKFLFYCFGQQNRLSSSFWLNLSFNFFLGKNVEHHGVEQILTFEEKISKYKEDILARRKGIFQDWIFLLQIV